MFNSHTRTSIDTHDVMVEGLAKSGLPIEIYRVLSYS